MRFFVLQNSSGVTGDAITDYVPVDGSAVGEAPRCAICGKYLGMLPLIPPIRVELVAWGVRWGDVAFGPGDQVLVSSRLMTLFLEQGLTGLTRLDETHVVKIKRCKPDIGDPPTYYLASIQLSRAVVDGKASGLVRSERLACAECHLDGVIKRAKRVILQSGTWSGEDVFFARGLPGTILVSERFQQMSQRAALTNCVLIPAEEFTFDYYPQERDKFE